MTTTKQTGREPLTWSYADRPWTAFRCMRMLRPIFTEITCLKVAKYGTARDPVALSKNTRKRSANDSDEDTVKPSRSKPADPDWVPEPEDRKPAKRLYTGRPPGRSDQGRSLRPGELSATPLIARHSGSIDARPYESPQTHQENPLSRGPNLAPSLKFFKTLDADATAGTPTDVLQHIDRLFTNFRHLLMNTTLASVEMPSEDGERCVWGEDKDDGSSGSRSLLAMCLRQVPIYMDGRQAWENETSEKRNVSQEVYEELEELGTNDEGWKKLRQVVRAHATNLLVQAIEADLLNQSQLHCLIRLCDEHDADDISREFLVAFAYSCGPLPPPSGSSAQLFQYESATYPGVSAMYSWAEKNHDWSFFFREIGKMITARFLPFEWLATKAFKPVWTRIICAASYSGSRSRFEATELLRTAILVSCGIYAADGEGSPLIHAKYSYSVVHFMKKAFSTSITSLCTILSSIVLVSNQEYGSQPEDASAVHRTLEGIAAELVCKVFADGFLEAFSKGSAAPERIATVLATALVIGICGKQLESPLLPLHHSNIIAALHAINQSAPKALENLPELVCSIVKSCGKINKEDGFVQLQAIVVYLLGTGGHKTSWFMERLALDSADEFAHTFQSGKQDRKYSRDRDGYFAFLREVETVVDSRQQGMSLVPTPFRRALRDADFSRTLLQSSDRSGYRWEAGLSEWVAITPRARRPQHGQTTCIPPSKRAATRLAWDEIKSDPTKGSSLSHQSIESEATNEGFDVDLSSPINKQREPPESQDGSSYSMTPSWMPTLGESPIGPRPNHPSPIVLIPARRHEAASEHRPPPPKFKVTHSGTRLRKRRSPKEPKHNYSYALRRSTRNPKRTNTMPSSLDTVDSGIGFEDSSESQTWSSDAEASRKGSSSSSISSSLSLQSSQDSSIDDNGDVTMTEGDSDDNPLDDTDELSFLHVVPARRCLSPSVVIPASESRFSSRSHHSFSSASSRQKAAAASQHDAGATAKKLTRSSRHRKSKAQDSEEHDLGSEDELSFL